MKGFVKVIIAGAIILGIGLIMFIALLGVNGWSFNPDWEMQTYECAEDDTKLKLEYSAGEISTVFYDGDKIKVEYPECKNYTTAVSESEGTLSVISGERHWYNFSLWTRKIPAATVYIPRDAVLSLDLTVNAGTLKLAGGEFANVKLTMNAGTVNADKLTADSMVIKLNAGTANFAEVLSGNLDIELNAGTVNMKIDGVSSEYSVSVEKNAGSCNLSSHAGTTDKKIDIEVNAGSCNVNFSN